ncbi:MAG: hypothetical protein ACK5U0_12245 [Gemmatimonas sp.]|uniref:hypothetical protein n=1 Tax=Gemmatimonas sp. TaxID=1962908 RepID=UPI00391D3C76
MSSDPEQDLGPGDVVQFEFAGAPVRGTIRRVDEKALVPSPFGLPYLVTVTNAHPASGYRAGRDYTLRAASLVRIGEPAPRAAHSVPRRPGSAPAHPCFLVGYRREGGQLPVQGTLLVQAPSLDAANALATDTLRAALATDIAEGRETEGASVMLVNAAEVSTTASASAAVLAQVSW